MTRTALEGDPAYTNSDLPNEGAAAPDFAHDRGGLSDGALTAVSA